MNMKTVLNLHPNIIALIIELGLQDDHLNFPILVSHVCARLREIALAIPMLWTTVSFSGGRPNYDEVKARLARSKADPINVSVTNLELCEDVETMFQLLYPHIHRWKSLSLEVWETGPAELVADKLVDAAPLLESLSLTGIAPAPFNPFSGNTPSLRQLTVKGMSLVWDSPLFYTLDTLYIQAPTWSSAALLGQKLKTLVIRCDPLQPLALRYSLQHVILPELEDLELNGVTKEDVVWMLSHVEMPNLNRMLFTHIKDSSNPVSTRVFPLLRVDHLRLHATEMRQETLLSVLREVRNLSSITFEDSSPIPTFIQALTPSINPNTWIIPALTNFKVVAFEKDNAYREYDDTDIAAALSEMMRQRQPVKGMVIRMYVFEGERDDITRHAADWDQERPYKTERAITLDSEGASPFPPAPTKSRRILIPPP